MNRRAILAVLRKAAGGTRQTGMLPMGRSKARVAEKMEREAEKAMRWKSDGPFSGTSAQDLPRAARLDNAAERVRGARVKAADLDERIRETQDDLAAWRGEGGKDYADSMAIGRVRNQRRDEIARLKERKRQLRRASVIDAEFDSPRPPRRRLKAMGL